MRHRFRRLRVRGALTMTMTEPAPFTTEPLGEDRLNQLVSALRPVLADDQLLLAKTDR